ARRAAGGPGERRNVRAQVPQEGRPERPGRQIPEHVSRLVDVEEQEVDDELCAIAEGKVELPPHESHAAAELQEGVLQSIHESLLDIALSLRCCGAGRS